MDEEAQKELNKELNEVIETSEVREMAAALAKNLLEGAEKLLAERKLDPLTDREKIILLGVASAVTLSTITAAIGIAMSNELKP
jgi:2-phosphoglycerate kinase